MLITGADALKFTPSEKNEESGNASDERFRELARAPIDRKILRTIDVDLSRTFPRHQFFTQLEQHQHRGAVESAENDVDTEPSESVAGMSQLDGVLRALVAYDSATRCVTVKHLVRNFNVGVQ